MNSISIENLNKLSEEVKTNLEIFDAIGQPLVDEYCQDLDSKVSDVRNYLNAIREYNLEFDVLSLQKIVIDLSSCIYYTSDKYEKLSLLENMAKVKAKDKYNQVYLANQGKAKLEDRVYTKDQLKSLAEQESLEEELIHFIYEHAAAIIKSKLEAAEELLKATSKSLSGEIQKMSAYGVSNKYQ